MDKRVAMIGGLDRLVPHYKRAAKVFGYDFFHHCGRCQSDKEKASLLNLVRKAEALFCPVDVNSHAACRLIKKYCKKEGKPFFFLRSSSVSNFKDALNFYLRRGYDENSYTF